MRTLAFVLTIAFGFSSLAQIWQNPQDLIRSGQLRPEREVLEVSLKWAHGKIHLVEATKRYGYINRSQPEGRNYIVEIWDQRKNVLSRHSISVSDKVFGAPLRNAQEVSSQHAQEHLRLLDENEIAINIPFAPKAHAVALFEERQLLSVKQLRPFQPVSKEPFQSLLLGPKMHWLVLNPIHITFIGHGFNRSNMDVFHNNVDAFIAELFKYEPFGRRQGHFVFHRVENTKSLSCAHDKTTPRLLVCNEAKVTRAVTNAGAPADQVVVVVNTSTYGGSGGTHAVTYNGSESGEVFVHELGHSFGWLKDEYTLENGGELTDQTSANCYAGIPPAAEWGGRVGAGDYHLGCHFEKWYRSSATSLMLTIQSPFFNRVSIKLLEEKMDSILQKP